MTTIGAALVGGAWLWDRFGAKVVEQAGKLGGDAGQQAWKKMSWKTAAERYRGEMQRLYGTMRIVGMAEPVALADIFTDVFLLDKPSAWRRYNIEELQRQVQGDPRDISREKRIDALDLVRRHERLMILGKPGAGKTTLLKHLVLQCTTGQIDAVPIFVGLKAWADTGVALMPFLVQQFAICAFPDAQPFIEQILAEGRALVLFDGLDEVNLEEGARERITCEVRDLADQYQRSRCVITCRTAASDYQFERFAYCELADFTEDQIRTFVGRWFQRDGAKHTAFLAEIAKPDHDRLRDLARTPLLLTLLCLAFDETMTFPPRRAELYEEALDALLKKWDASRSIKRDSVYRMLSLGHKRQMLARIAAETFAKNELFMRQDDLAERIAVYLAKLPRADVAEQIDGETILRSIEAQHGLLVERAQRIYSFSHLTFHEYFTACYTVEHPSRQMFTSVVVHAHDARWREVLLLTTSMLSDANAEIFFSVFDAMLSKLLQEDPILLTLFQWTQRKAALVAPPQQVAARELYTLLVLVTITVSTFLEIGLTASARNLARELALVTQLSRSRAKIVTPTSILGLISAFVSGLINVEDFDRAGDPSLSTVRDLGRALTQTLAYNASLQKVRGFQIDCVWTGILLWSQMIACVGLDSSNSRHYTDLLRIWHLQTTNISPNLRTVMTNLTLPDKYATADNWKDFTEELRAALVTHLDIGHSWALDNEQLNRLADYLAASNRMLECLDLAAVADRDAIRNRLLLPSQP